jgi:hypothetical protein
LSQATALIALAGVSGPAKVLAALAVTVLAVTALVLMRGWIATYVGWGGPRSNASLEPAAASAEGQVGQLETSALVGESDAAPAGLRLSSLGWFPWIAFVGASALYLVVYGYGLSRSGDTGAEPWFWIGIAGIIAPIGVRLATGRVRTLERVLLLLLLVLLLYLVKVLHDPFAFTFADEFVHATNVEQVIGSGQLPDENSIIPVSAQFPGLASAAAAVALLTGLSGFGAGIVVIGAARIVLALGLFVLFRRITGSPRIASLGVVFYACALNYLFWGAQFSYQSLAFPLAILALAAALSRTRAQSERRFAGQNLLWSAAALLAIVATVLTHHLTSYALAALLFVLAAATTIGSRFRWAPRWIAPWELAIVALGASLAWVFLSASETTSYLGPIFGTALEGSLNVVSGEESTRELFESRTGYVAPGWERIVSLLAVAITTVGVVIGVVKGGRLFSSRLMFWLFSFAAFVYIGSFGFRLVPKAWEIANRFSDYAYIGVAVILAAATIHLLRGRWGGAVGPAVLGVTIGVLVIGATLSSWPATVRLPPPYRVSVEDTTFAPEGVSVAGWSRDQLGTGRTFVADRSNGRLLLSLGGQVVYVARTPNARVLLEEPQIDPFQLQVIGEVGLEYVAVDRRLISDDNMAGYFFDRPGLVGPLDTSVRSESILRKFEAEPSVSKVLDSGNTSVYDVRSLGDAAERE